MENKTNPWTIVLAVVITAVVVGGGVYYWQTQNSTKVLPVEKVTTQPTTSDTKEAITQPVVKSNKPVITYPANGSTVNGVTIKGTAKPNSEIWAYVNYPKNEMACITSNSYASGGASTTGGIGGNVEVNATGLIQINGLFTSGGEGSMYPRNGGSASAHSTTTINITTIDTRGGEDTNIGDNSGSGGNAGPVLISLLSPFSGNTYFKNIYASGGNGSTGGNGSNVTIRAANLSLFEPIIFTYGGAGIDSTLNGGGFGGAIDINATSLNISVGSINASGRPSRGDSGKIFINAVTGVILNSSIFAKGGNFISTMATGTGAGGSINISFITGNLSLNELSTSGGTSRSFTFGV